MAGRPRLPDPDRRMDARRLPHGRRSTPRPGRPVRRRRATRRRRRRATRRRRRRADGAGGAERTAANVRDSDATLWFGDPSSPGGARTRQECWKHSRSFLPVEPGAPTLPSQVAAWLASMHVKTLNVAGNRESRAPGIKGRVERFLGVVLRRLGHDRETG